MPFINTNDYLTGRLPAVYEGGICDTTVRGSINLLTGDLTLNNTGAVLVLPAGCVPSRIVVDSDDLDANATPTIQLAVGVVNALGTDLSTAAVDGGGLWATGVTIAQTGGAVAPLSTAVMRVQATQTDRIVGVKITSAPATAQAGVLGVTMTYRAV